MQWNQCLWIQVLTKKVCVMCVVWLYLAVWSKTTCRRRPWVVPWAVFPVGVRATRLLTNWTGGWAAAADDFSCVPGWAPPRLLLVPGWTLIRTSTSCGPGTMLALVSWGYPLRESPAHLASEEAPAHLLNPAGRSGNETTNHSTRGHDIQDRNSSPAPGLVRTYMLCSNQIHHNPV